MGGSKVEAPAEAAVVRGRNRFVHCRVFNSTWLFLPTLVGSGLSTSFRPSTRTVTYCQLEASFNFEGMKSKSQALLKTLAGWYPRFHDMVLGLLLSFSPGV